ncbi:MAG: sugar kinase [Actinomycetota bacterium]|nr:sugar kinase [Actinomycetota bacterium]MDH4353233.1 sugar kinase [Actinomycetota bacterium]MDH5279074.1 sugar kinase [Actinomycetota bacterium]
MTDDARAGRVVAFGDLFTDVVAHLHGDLRYADDVPARVSTHGGGAAANTAAWVAHLGHDASFVGRVGADVWGRAAVEVLVSGGVDCHVSADPALPTGTCIVLVDGHGERSMVTDSGASAQIRASDLPGPLFVPGNHLHVSGFSLIHDAAREAALSALRQAGEHGMTRSVDPGAMAVIESVGAERLLDWLRGVDLVFPNEDEARVLAGVDDPVEAAEKLAQDVGAVVVKLGADGAAWTDGVSLVHRDAAGGPVLDTTGAGDAFAAGYLGQWLAQAPPDAALAAGVRTAALCVARVGGRPT